MFSDPITPVATGGEPPHRDHPPGKKRKGGPRPPETAEFPRANRSKSPRGWLRATIEWPAAHQWPAGTFGTDDHEEFARKAALLPGLVVRYLADNPGTTHAPDIRTAFRLRNDMSPAMAVRCERAHYANTKKKRRRDVEDQIASGTFKLLRWAIDECLRSGRVRIVRQDGQARKIPTKSLYVRLATPEELAQWVADRTPPAPVRAPSKKPAPVIPATATEIPAGHILMAVTYAEVQALIAMRADQQEGLPPVTVGPDDLPALVALRNELATRANETGRFTDL